jgi:glycosyltransferase involved in cell wall biosynthesis
MTRNAAPQVATCLEKLRDFGEIVLVDSFSTDGTVEIARNYSAIVYSRPRCDSAETKNWALDRARHDWVLALGADETLTDRLKAELARIDESDAIDGYRVRRMRTYLGRPVRRCAGPEDTVLRLFRRSRRCFDGTRSEAEVTVRGNTAPLAGELVHNLYCDLGQHIRYINECSTREARSDTAAGRRGALAGMIWRPLIGFVRGYIWRGAVLDGWRGLVFCLVSSYGVFLAHAKIWEATGAVGRIVKPRDPFGDDGV